MKTLGYRTAITRPIAANDVERRAFVGRLIGDLPLLLARKLDGWRPDLSAVTVRYSAYLPADPTADPPVSVREQPWTPDEPLPAWAPLVIAWLSVPAAPPLEVL